MAPNAPGLRVEIADVNRAFALRSEDGRWVWTERPATAPASRSATAPV
jgi:hypothetical protein